MSVVVSEKFIQEFRDKEKMIQILFQEIRDLKQTFQQLFDSIPLDYNEFSEHNYEFYSTGTKKQWIEWFKKFKEALKENPRK